MLMLPGTFSTTQLTSIKITERRNSGAGETEKKNMSWSISLLSGTKLDPNLQFQDKIPVTNTRCSSKIVRCIPVKQQAESGSIMCEPCSGSGWLCCDFCNGQKTNVKASNNKIYRRCPSCKAVGYILCTKCKVFKCVTFPDFDDGEDLIF